MTANTIPPRGATSKTMRRLSSAALKGATLRPAQAPAPPPPPPKSSLPLAAAVLVGALAGGVGVVLALRSRPSPPPAHLPPVQAAVVKPALTWSGSSVRVVWASADRYQARLESLGQHGATTGPEAAEAYLGTEHDVTLAGLRPGSEYRIRANAGERLLFECPGRTRSLDEMAGRLLEAIKTVDPQSLVRKLRTLTRGKLLKGNRSAPEPAGGPRQSWSSMFAKRVEQGRLASAAADFASGSEAYFGSQETPLGAKLSLYRLLQDMAELERASEDFGMPVPPVARQAMAPSHGPARGSALETSGSVALVFAAASEGMCAGLTFQPSGPAIAIAKGVHFLAPFDARRVPWQPGEMPAGPMFAPTWFAEPEAALPLPEPARIRKAELRAVVSGAHAHNAFRVFLRATGSREWIAIAQLRASDDGTHELWHGLDPRVLARGSHVRVEMIYSPEGPIEQRACLAGLEFRWERN